MESVITPNQRKSNMCLFGTVKPQHDDKIVTTDTIRRPNT